mmetsp:Transcript_51450/g.120451  ORF Transcript_51450/g.120451 Transcript_51450/m.120451 type:complete len:205 (-) Transcript_51450:1611-2225(-)
MCWNAGVDPYSASWVFSAQAFQGVFQSFSSALPKRNCWEGDRPRLQGALPETAERDGAEVPAREAATSSAILADRSQQGLPEGRAPATIRQTRWRSHQGLHSEGAEVVERIHGPSQVSCNPEGRIPGSSHLTNPCSCGHFQGGSEPCSCLSRHPDRPSDRCAPHDAFPELQGGRVYPEDCPRLALQKKDRKTQGQNGSREDSAS